MSNLFEIDKNLLEYVNKGFELCVNEDGEIDEEKLNHYLQVLPEQRENKLEGYGMLIKQLNAESIALKTEIDKLAEIKASKDKKIESLKKAVTMSMTAFGDTKFETAKVLFSFRKSETVEVDIDKLDKTYIKEVVEYKADKTAIKNAIKEGKEVNGAVIIQKQNLQVK